MTWKQIKEKCIINIDINLVISLFSSEWFYLIPTIRCIKTNKYFEIEFDFLTFYLYASFNSHENEL